MAYWLGSGVRRTIATVTVFLAAGVSGCDRRAIPVTWEATGVQVTRLEMLLDEHGNSFIVGEYALEGREGSGDPVRTFRDRVLLTVHAQGIESHVLGYITRTYDSGQVRTLRLYGTERRVARDSKTMVVTGWAHGLAPAGSGPYPFMAWIEVRLDSASGRILAQGSSHGPPRHSQARTDSRANATLPKSPPIR